MFKSPKSPLVETTKLLRVLPTSVSWVLAESHEPCPMEVTELHCFALVAISLASGPQAQLGNRASFSKNPFSPLQRSSSHLLTQVMGRRGMLMDESLALLPYSKAKTEYSKVQAAFGPEFNSLQDPGLPRASPDSVALSMSLAYKTPHLRVRTRCQGQK